jgi:RNA polymerase sigma-70 factor (ECF subfamily)
MNEKEFEITVLSFREKVFRVALRYMQNSDDAEDAVQDVVLKLWRMNSKLAQYDSIEALAMTMMRNRCIDILRKENKLSDLSVVHIQKNSTSDERRIEARSEVEILHKVMQSLPEMQRAVLHLREIEQYEFKEIAEVLGIEVNAIRVNLSRARKKMRDELLKHRNYGLDRTREVNR